MIVFIIGRIPLRELVYRVLDLPSSMRPLVYDFGQLKKGTEDEYIEHIVRDHVSGILMLWLTDSVSLNFINTDTKTPHSFNRGSWYCVSYYQCVGCFTGLHEEASSKI